MELCNGSKQTPAGPTQTDALGAVKAVCPVCHELNRVRDGSMRNHYRRADVARLGVWDSYRR